MRRVAKVVMGLETPVVFILGATGTGKTELGVRLAKRFGGEVINADSMQIYKGLDVVTNKADSKLLDEVRHHLINIVEPLNETFNVTQFRDLAVPIIDALLENGRMPVVVGGTNYYAEALLWRCLLGDEVKAAARPLVGISRDATNEFFLTPTVGSRAASPGEPGPGLAAAAAASVATEEADVMAAAAVAARLDFEHLRRNIGRVDGRKLHALLMRIDASYARAVHPNTTRKTIRALEAFVQNGRTVSSLHGEQRLRPALAAADVRGGCGSVAVDATQPLPAALQLQSSSSLFGGSLRYERSLVLWLRCAQPTLDARLDARVDGMLERGLLGELLDFHRRYNALRLRSDGDEKCSGAGSSDGGTATTTSTGPQQSPADQPDYSKGIFQSIGFKEFHDYLTLPDGEQQGETGRRLLERGIAAMKTATRRYARYQVKWVAKRFLEQREQRDVPPVYALDSTDLDQWQAAVLDRACDIVGAALRGEQPLDDGDACRPQPVVVDNCNPVVHRQCDVCGDGRVFVRQVEWAAHCRSRQHTKMASRRRREQLQPDGPALQLQHDVGCTGSSADGSKKPMPTDRGGMQPSAATEEQQQELSHLPELSAAAATQDCCAQAAERNDGTLPPAAVSDGHQSMATAGATAVVGHR